MLINVLAASDASNAAISAALGGLLGALLTLAITGWRERRKTRAEDLATVRLIELEVGNARRAATWIRDDDPPLYTAFPVSAWEAGRVRLARSLDALEWLVVANAYDAIHEMNWRYQHDVDLAAGAMEGPPALEPEPLREVCARIIATADEALPLLRDRQ